jgi:transcription elongation factor Elf1
MPQAELPKKVGRKKVHDEEKYRPEYENHTRCPKCKKLKNGIEEFKSKTGKLKKHCSLCRANSLAIVKKTLPTSKRDKYNAFKQILKKVNKEQLFKVCKDDPELLSYIKYITE